MSFPCVFLFLFLFLCNFVFSCALAELSQHRSKHKEDVSVLQKSIVALDREKDSLLDEVDQKTERVFALQEENAKKVASATPCSHSYLFIRINLFGFVSFVCLSFTGKDS